jgi:hypothetical protein
VAPFVLPWLAIAARRDAKNGPPRTRARDGREHRRGHAGRDAAAAAAIADAAQDK